MLKELCLLRKIEADKFLNQNKHRIENGIVFRKLTILQGTTAMDLSHLIVKQKNLAVLANEHAVTATLPISLQKKLADMSAQFAQFDNIRRMSDLAISTDFGRLNAQIHALTSTLHEAIRPMDTISQSIRKALSSIETLSSPMDDLRKTMRGLEGLSELTSTASQIQEMLHETGISRALDEIKRSDPLFNLRSSLNQLAGTHQAWLNTVQTFDNATLERLTPVIAIPSHEYFSAVASFGQFVDIEIEPGIEAQSPETDDELPNFEELLRRYAPSSIECWHGALAALSGRGSDYQRHVTVSVREFFEEVLRSLAPNDRIVDFLAQKGETLKDKPGWGLRAEVACLSVGQTSFSACIAETTGSFKNTIATLQETVHTIEPSHSHAQLQHLVRHSRRLAEHMLEIHFLATIQ